MAHIVAAAAISFPAFIDAYLRPFVRVDEGASRLVFGQVAGRRAIETPLYPDTAETVK
jgi:hypothetical protein